MTSEHLARSCHVRGEGNGPPCWQPCRGTHPTLQTFQRWWPNVGRSYQFAAAAAGAAVGPPDEVWGTSRVPSAGAGPKGDGSGAGGA